MINKEKRKLMDRVNRFLSENEFGYQVKMHWETEEIVKLYFYKLWDLGQCFRELWQEIKKAFTVKKIEKETIKSFTSTCESCGIINCKYVGVWKTDHWTKEELREEHNWNCKL